MTSRHPSSAGAPLLRALWIPVFGDALGLGILLALLATAIRGVGMLGPQRFFWILPVGFILMAASPYLFSRREGRRRSGLCLPERPAWIVWGILLGLTAALVCYWLGISLFGEEIFFRGVLQQAVEERWNHLTGVLFAFLRRKSGSLIAPILAHAAFNLGMNYTIFYLL